MPKFIAPLLALLFLLAACDRGVQFKIRFADAAGLAVGAPLLLDGQTVGRVRGVENVADGSQLVEVEIRREFLSAATVDTRFYLAENREDAGSKYIELVQSQPGGQAIKQGQVVQGSSPDVPSLFADMFREFSDRLGDFRKQMEGLRRELENLPDSPQGRKLQEEWKRLLEEIPKAGDAMKKDLLPKLQEELDKLRQRRRELEENRPSPTAKPLET